MLHSSTREENATLCSSGGNMELYNYFSFSAKKAIYRASEICQNFNNPFVEPEHVLFSILQLRSCSAVQVLNRLNVNLPKFSYNLEAYLYERASDFKGNPQFSARTLALLDLGFREVKKLGHREIGTSHLLIALAQERHHALRKLLDEHRLDAKRVRDAFIEHQRGFAHAQQSQAEPAAAGASALAAPLHMGGVTFAPGKTFSAPALSVLAGAAQLALTLRQPLITPVELLAALLIDPARRQFHANHVLARLDSLQLLARLAEHWPAHALPQRPAPAAEPLLSPALTDLLGRAVSCLLQSCVAEAGAHAVGTEHLLLAVLDEPTDPVRSWLAVQLGANPELAHEVAVWRGDMAAATLAAQQASAEATAWTAPAETEAELSEPDAPASSPQEPAPDEPAEPTPPVAE